MKKEKQDKHAGDRAFTILGLVYIAPILIVLMNSFKKKSIYQQRTFYAAGGKDVERP